MKALVHYRYGPPEDMQLVDLPKPEPAEGQVLVKVEAVSLNGSDAEIKLGRPAYTRLFGLSKPRVRVLGSDVAGVVETVGDKVDRFQPGDRVFGDALGTFGGLAEFAAIPAKMLTKIPDGMGFETAAALPQGAAIAHQAVRRPKKLKPGQRILINGAGGSAGVFAVQMAKNDGLHVTAVDRAEKLAALRDLGADLTIDFGRIDFSATGQKWDRIVDLVATRPARHVADALAPGGTYWAVGGPLTKILDILVMGAIIRLSKDVRIRILAADQSAKAMEPVLRQIASGRLKPVIDSRFSLENAPEALRRLVDGKAFGKILVLPPK